MAGTVRVDSAKIQRLRKQQGLSLAALAEEAGVDKGTALRADHGENAQLGTLRKLARALGVQPGDLMAEESDREEPDDVEKADKAA